MPFLLSRRFWDGPGVKMLVLLCESKVLGNPDEVLK